MSPARLDPPRSPLGSLCSVRLVLLLLAFALQPIAGCSEQPSDPADSSETPADASDSAGDDSATDPDSSGDDVDDGAATDSDATEPDVDPNDALEADLEPTDSNDVPDSNDSTDLAEDLLLDEGSGCPNDGGCPSAGETFCAVCTLDEECGGQPDLCLTVSDQSRCSADCSGDFVCPDGFECAEIEEDGAVIAEQCYPLAAFIDECGVCGGSGAPTWYADTDADGLGDPEATTVACEQPDDYVPNDSDPEPGCATNDTDVCGVCAGDGSSCLDCDGVADGEATLDDCDVCSGGTSEHEANSDQDCAGVCFGEATIDDCEVCSGGTSEHVADSDIDCDGVCFGTAALDTCDVCSGGTTGHAANSDIDCDGVCFGTAALDTCDVCSGGTTGHAANSDIDCDGVCFGTASLDTCDVCSGGTTEHVADSDIDCDGVCFGTASLDTCDVCSGGTTEHVADSDIDCDGVCFGTASLDTCSVCSGGTTDHVADSDIDCDGVCFGTAAPDTCDVCSGGTTEHVADSDIDCDGVCFGTASLDTCDVCSGGTTDHVADSDVDCLGECFGEARPDCLDECEGSAVVNCDFVCGDPTYLDGTCDGLLVGRTFFGVELDANGQATSTLYNAELGFEGDRYPPDDPLAQVPGNPFGSLSDGVDRTDFQVFCEGSDIDFATDDALLQGFFFGDVNPASGRVNGLIGVNPLGTCERPTWNGVQLAPETARLFYFEEVCFDHHTNQDCNAALEGDWYGLTSGGTSDPDAVGRPFALGIADDRFDYQGTDAAGDPLSLQGALYCRELGGPETLEVHLVYDTPATLNDVPQRLFWDLAASSHIAEVPAGQARVAALPMGTCDVDLPSSTDWGGDYEVWELNLGAVPVSCHNGVLDGDEIDIDCGGSFCPGDFDCLGECNGAAVAGCDFACGSEITHLTGPCPDILAGHYFEGVELDDDLQPTTTPAELMFSTPEGLPNPTGSLNSSFNLEDFQVFCDGEAIDFVGQDTVYQGFLIEIPDSPLITVAINPLGSCERPSVVDDTLVPDTAMAFVFQEAPWPCGFPGAPCAPLLTSCPSVLEGRTFSGQTLDDTWQPVSSGPDSRLTLAGDRQNPTPPYYPTGALAGPFELPDFELFCLNQDGLLSMDFVAGADVHRAWATIQSDPLGLDLTMEVSTEPSCFRPDFSSSQPSCAPPTERYHFTEVCADPLPAEDCNAVLQGTWHGLAFADATPGRAAARPFTLDIAGDAFSYVGIDTEGQPASAMGTIACQQLGGLDELEVFFAFESPEPYAGLTTRAYWELSPEPRPTMPPGQTRAAVLLPFRSCEASLPTHTSWGGNHEVWELSLGTDPVSCFNGVQDGDETDVDCGGTYCSSVPDCAGECGGSAVVNCDFECGDRTYLEGTCNGLLVGRAFYGVELDAGGQATSLIYDTQLVFDGDRYPPDDPLAQVPAFPTGSLTDGFDLLDFQAFCLGGLIDFVVDDAVHQGFLLPGFNPDAGDRVNGVVGINPDGTCERPTWDGAQLTPATAKLYYFEEACFDHHISQTCNAALEGEWQGLTSGGSGDPDAVGRLFTLSIAADRFDYLGTDGASGAFNLQGAVYCREAGSPDQLEVHLVLDTPASVDGLPLRLFWDTAASSTNAEVPPGQPRAAALPLGICDWSLPDTTVWGGEHEVWELKLDAAPVSCHNGLQDGDESGVDCGGTYCAACL